MNKQTKEHYSAVIENNFSFHRADPQSAEKYETIRGTAKEYAYKLIELCPDSRELAEALSKLEEVAFWANASVARYVYVERPQPQTQQEGESK